MSSLPIDPFIPEILQSLRQHASLVLVAEPGAGKTTRVAPAVITSGILAPGEKLVLLQPRRVAARAIAGRIAQENGWTLGDQVGYQIRLEKQIRLHTPLRVMTEGVLTRQLLADPFLEGIGMVVLDEFHQRSVHSDMALAMLRQIQQSVRPELRILVMSATLDTGPVTNFLGGAAAIHVPGRAFPVHIRHQPAADVRLEQHIGRTIEQLLSSADRNGEDPGDILIFLPGIGEIMRCQQIIEPAAKSWNLLVLPLHGSMTLDEQVRALNPAAQRKVILATNIAETSLTISGVQTVIDSGLERRAGYDPGRGMDRLEKVRISRASATQRAGRAGRTAPGVCIRLWSLQEDRQLAPFDPPEIMRVDLSGVILNLYAWDKRGPRNFEWFEAPSPMAVSAAETQLRMLGAIGKGDAQGLTDIGRELAALPVHPRLGRLIAQAARSGLLPQASLLAALISEKDILRRNGDRVTTAAGKISTDSDLLYRMELCRRSSGQKVVGSFNAAEIDSLAVRNVHKVQDDILQIGNRLAAAVSIAEPVDKDKALLRLLLTAYPDRVCRRRPGDHQRAVMVGGKGVRLGPGSSVHKAEFFLAIEVQQNPKDPRGEAVVNMASGIDPAWLAEIFPNAITTSQVVEWDEKSQRVAGWRRVAYHDLMIEESPMSGVSASDAALVLAQTLQPRTRELFAAHAGAASLLARIEFLRSTMPELALPEMMDDDLWKILEQVWQANSNMPGLRDIEAADLAGLIRDGLPHTARRSLDLYAPAAMKVPSGRTVPLEYGPDGPPVLAVRLQELFGLAETPRIGGGRVSVRLNLLGPNYRPVQVTNDLASFWKGAYFQVRKDLRARYPKHAWPENPSTAQATRIGENRNTKH